MLSVAGLALGLWLFGLSSVSAGEPRPPREGREAPERDQGRREGPQRYSIEQAVSDQAQLHTIAFNGLAFVTGDFGASTFIRYTAGASTRFSQMVYIFHPLPVQEVCESRTVLGPELNESASVCGKPKRVPPR